MKNKVLISTLSMLALLSVISCNNASTTSNNVNTSSESIAINPTTTASPSSSTTESFVGRLTRENALKLIDSFVETRSTTAGVVVNKVKIGGNSSVGGTKISEETTPVEFNIIDGKVTILEKEFTFILTKELFRTNYLNDIGELISENYSYGVIDEDKLSVAITYKSKSDNQYYKHSLQIDKYGRFSGGVCYKNSTNEFLNEHRQYIIYTPTY